MAARSGHTYARVWQDLFDQAEQQSVFVKEFAYSVDHCIDDHKLSHLKHSFLIRDPYKVVQGLGHHWPDCSFKEAGFESLARLFDRVCELNSEVPPVITSEELLGDPKGTVAAWCGAVGIEFKAEALSWEPGARQEVSWYNKGAGLWHDSLRQSSTIEPQKRDYPPLEDNDRLMDIYRRCLPHYEHLRRHKLAIGGNDR